MYLPKLSFIMLERFGHWSLCHSSFLPKSKKVKIIWIFSKFLRIVAILLPVPIFQITFLFRSHFSKHFSFPVPSFESNFLFRSPFFRYTFLFRSPVFRYTLSLEFLKKIKLFFIFNFLEEKNYDTVTSGQDFLPY